MANKVKTFAGATNPAVRAYDNATMTNAAGHPAWERSIEERTIQLLMTNTLDRTFYVGAEELSKETDSTFRAILAKDPEFFAKAIVHARNDGCMRLVPIVGLVYLSTVAREKKDLFRQAFRQTIRTPHDLASFVQWSRKAGIRKGLGQGVKAAINYWLNGMSEYHAIKYPLESSKEGYSLRDIIRVTRPVPRSEKQKAIFRWVVKGELPETTGTIPQIEAFEKLKRATSAKEVRQLIEVGRIPHEVATGVVKPDAETWRFIMHQMPHFALLRNLNTLHRNGLFGDPLNVTYVAGKLSEEAAVLNSKVLPFRYHEAIRAYTKNASHSQAIVESLVKALEVSFKNLPEITGNVVIAVDVSGSMGGNATGGKSEVSYSDIASIFAAALFKKSPTCKVLPFGERVVDFHGTRQDSLYTTAQKLQHQNMSTDLGSPIQFVRQNKVPCDVFIGVTDNMEWYTAVNGYGGQSRGFYGEWLTHKAANPNARAFLVRIDPNKGAASPPEDSNVTLIYGWSPVVLDFIVMAQRGFGAQVEAVRQIDLRTPKERKAKSAETSDE